MQVWPVVKLGDVCEIQRGGSPRPIDQYITNSDNGINWIKIGDVGEGEKYIRSTQQKIKPEGAQRSRRVEIGDFLLTNSMSFGRPYILRTSGCIHDGWLVLRYDKEKLCEDYLYHALSSDFVCAQFTKLASGAVVKNLNSDVVKVVDIPLPPLSEQRRIAAILDKADALRAKRREALAQLDRLAQAIFVEMFGEPGTNAKGWPRRDLASLVSNGDSINYGVVQPGDDVPEGVPLIRVGDLIDGVVRHDGLKRISPEIERAYQRSRLQGDELVISCVGSVGVVALISEKERGFNIARAVARIRLDKSMERGFFAVQLGMPCVQRYFVQELRTVSQPTLNIKQIAETQLIVPPVDLQKKFVGHINAANEIRQRHLAAANAAESLFASLQHRAFRGEL